MRGNSQLNEPPRIFMDEIMPADEELVTPLMSVRGTTLQKCSVAPRTIEFVIVILDRKEAHYRASVANNISLNRTPVYKVWR